MFCPKCGIQNPETGKFCRSCGTDLGNVSDALSGKLPVAHNLVNDKGKPISLESAITKFFMGIAFLAIAIILGVSGRGSGWWFWMMIPALMFLGNGAAQYVQLKSAGRTGARFAPPDQPSIPAAIPNAALPHDQTSRGKFRTRNDDIAEVIKRSVSISESSGQLRSTTRLSRLSDS